MNRQDRFLQRNRKVAQARRGAKDTVGNQEYAALREEGWKMTDDQYKAYKTKEGEWDTALGTAQKGIADARSALKTRKSEIDKASGQLKSTSLDSEYSKYKKGFVPVRVVDGDKIEGTYYLPKEAIGSMDKDINEGYHGNWVDGGKAYNVDVQTKGGGGKRGQDLHDSLRQGQDTIKAKFYKANAGAVKKTNDEVNKGKSLIGNAYTNLESERGLVDAEETSIKTAVSDRQSKIDNAANDYSTGLAGRRKLMSTGA